MPFWASCARHPLTTGRNHLHLLQKWKGSTAASGEKVGTSIKGVLRLSAPVALHACAAQGAYCYQSPCDLHVNAAGIVQI